MNPDMLTILGFLVVQAGPLLALLFRTEARITRLETLVEGVSHTR